MAYLGQHILIPIIFLSHCGKKENYKLFITSRECKWLFHQKVAFFKIGITASSVLGSLVRRKHFYGCEPLVSGNIIFHKNKINYKNNESVIY